MIEPFQETVFAVPMTCESCVQDITASLDKIDGIQNVDVNLSSQLVSVRGTAAPSVIVASIEATGRDAILRGTGSSNSAAVCILETHSSSAKDVVRGLARIVQVSPTLTLVDLTIRGLSPDQYFVTVRETGDISEGAASAGGVWGAVESASTSGNPAKGLFGSVTVEKNGAGSVFLNRPVQVWEMIGRSMVISKQSAGLLSKEDPDTLVGVIARSAGVWENEKTVCSCTGKTVWEERKEQIGRGIV